MASHIDHTSTQLAILQMLSNYSYAFGSQIQRLYFTSGTQQSNVRLRNKTLQTLADTGLIERLPRKVGGLDGPGSAEYCYALTRAGQRLVNQATDSTKPFKRLMGRTPDHVKHSLTITELYTQMVENDHLGRVKLHKFQGEPACHRGFGSGRTLKPDGYCAFDTDKFRLAWFLEVERFQQRHATIEAKLKNYKDYMRSVKPDSFMPRVLFVVRDAKHQRVLENILAGQPPTDQALFAVTERKHATATMIGTLPA
jgi:hypothetical protein